MRRPKQLLDTFALATGLKINFSKSTVVPMHVSTRLLPRLVRILGCKPDVFPQVYLGLPLSNNKLPLSAFTNCCTAFTTRKDLPGLLGRESEFSFTLCKGRWKAHTGKR